MTLDPDTFECPDHQTNLTAQVQEALEDDRPPIAYKGRWAPGKRAPAAGPFQVIVTCPGEGAAAPHQLTCTGTRTG